MKKRKQALVMTLVFCAMIVVINKLRFRYSWTNATLRTAMTPFTGTIWADGFSEANFSKVQAGMSSRDIKLLLGEPLQKWCGNEGCEWLYSWQDTPTADFDRRWIFLNSVGRVVSFRHDFFID